MSTAPIDEAVVSWALEVVEGEPMKKDEPRPSPYNIARRVLDLDAESARLRAELKALGPVTEMSLCEQGLVGLRPGQLYRFTVTPGCAACEAAAWPYKDEGASPA